MTQLCPQDALDAALEISAVPEQGKQGPEPDPILLEAAEEATNEAADDSGSEDGEINPEDTESEEEWDGYDYDEDEDSDGSASEGDESEHEDEYAPESNDKVPTSLKYCFCFLKISPA